MKKQPTTSRENQRRGVLKRRGNGSKQLSGGSTLNICTITATAKNVKALDPKLRAILNSINNDEAGDSEKRIVLHVNDRLESSNVCKARGSEVRKNIVGSLCTSKSIEDVLFSASRLSYSSNASTKKSIIVGHAR